IIFHTLYTIRQLKIMSDKTRGIHIRLTKALMLQIVIPGVTLLLPSLGFNIMYRMRLDSPELARIMFQIMGLHSIVHSITIILSTD
ncbi:hypothetical protein PMAYCL1PPCAC_22302, partial [Pristionchus mayeri]